MFAKESTETYLLELTPYKGLCVVIQSVQSVTTLQALQSQGIQPIIDFNKADHDLKLTFLMQGVIYLFYNSKDFFLENVG